MGLGHQVDGDPIGNAAGRLGDLGAEVRHDRSRIIGASARPMLIEWPHQGVQLMKSLLVVSAVCLFVTVATATGQQPPAGLNVGDKAPDFSLPGTDGKTHSLSAYKGHTVVLAWFPQAFTGG